MSFLAYSTPWDCIVDFYKTPHGFTLAKEVGYKSTSLSTASTAIYHFVLIFFGTRLL